MPVGAEVGSIVESHALWEQRLEESGTATPTQIEEARQLAQLQMNKMREIAEAGGRARKEGQA